MSEPIYADILGILYDYLRENGLNVLEVEKTKKVPKEYYFLLNGKRVNSEPIPG